MRIMVFTEGTILYHRAALNQPRETIVQQVRDKEPSTHDFSSYLPIGEAHRKIAAWSSQGHQIMYLTSRKKPEEINAIKEVLRKHKFPMGELLYRSSDEEYHEVVERNMPDVLIEDDCESIGGISMMVYPKIRQEIKKRIISVPVKEFGGIDQLPDKINDIKKDAKKEE